MKRIGILLVVAGVLVGGSNVGHAQNLNDIINLMGRAIENDMETKRRDRQRYLDHQAAKNRERQQRNVERRAEIALVQRMQSGLQSLGFYTSKIDGDRGPGTRAAETQFSAAFGLPPLSLSENDVQLVERYAAAGYRNRDEVRSAQAGGFFDRDEMVAAQQGGFDNAAEYRDAKAIGIGAYEDYSNFKRSGFTSVGDFLAAKRGGFTDPSEYQKATASGFASRPEYAEFLESGADTKLEFQEIMQRKSLAAAEIAKCSAAPVETALPFCAVALSLAEPSSQVLKLRFSEIGAHLKDQRAKLTKMTTEPEELASADGGAASGLSGSAGSTTADVFLVELASVDAALRAHECGTAYLEADWNNAVRICSASKADSISGISEIAAIAVSTQLAEKQQAAAEMERKRAVAEAERTRIALAAAVERSTTLQAQLGDYSGSGGRFDNPLPVARAMVELRKQTQGEDFKAIEQAALALEELIASEPRFQTFVDQSRRAAQIAAVNANASAEAELRRIEAFIEDHVTRNILAPEVADLLTLQTELAESRGSANSDMILNARKKAHEALKSLELMSALDEFVFAEGSEQISEVESAENGLAVTGLNRDLLTGDGRDILILGNFTASAPNLAINLVGDTTFTGGTAGFCWQSGVSGLTVPVKLAVRLLQTLGANQLKDMGLCPRTGLDGVDLVLLERSKLLADDILNVGGFIAGYEQQEIRQIGAVLWSEVGAKSVEAEETAEFIRTDVMAGARTGYGVVRFENKSLQICFAVPNRDENAHLELLASQTAVLDLEFQGNLSTALMDLERAFITAQRNNCAAIYADAESLKMVLAGADRAGLTVRMLPLWLDDASFDSAKAAIAAEHDQAAKSLTARREEMQRRKAAEEQEQQVRAAQRAIDANTAAAVRARKTEELRARYGQQAKAAYNGLNDLGIAFFQNGMSTQFSELFPQGRSWAADMASNGWRFTKYSGELRDYGTAEWKGRRTEVVLVDMTIDASNNVRGEYSTDCFTAGYLIDAEFNQLRDAFIEPCDSDVAVMNWQKSRRFESRWSAP